MISAEPHSPTLSLDLQRQKLLDTAERSRSGLFVYTLLWVALSLADGYVHRHPWFVGIHAVCLLVAALGRYVIFRRLAVAVHEDFARARRVFRSAAWSYQAYWGVLCALVVASPDAPVLKWLMLMATVGLTCGGAAIMAIDTGLSRVYPPLLTGPVCLVFIWEGGAIGYTQAACFMALVAYTLKVSKTVGKDYADKLLAQAALEQRALELEQAHEAMKRLAIQDELTGLFNRRQMTVTLEEHAALSRRQLVSFSVGLFDLDHFKRVNDTWGHAVGDEVLRAFAQQARLVLRETDVIGRWGGEEFLVVMPGVLPGAAAPVFERLRQALASVPVNGGAAELCVNFSAGVTAFRPVESIEAAVERADAAHYEANAQGRGRTIEAP
jgi:diguanylate cyclase (GGDEF)-like protein